MDIIKLIDGIKGKVLDASKIDLLKHAYDLQNQNIEQLKTNNEAVRESHGLLQKKVEQIEAENTSLKKEVQRLTEAIGQNADATGLSKVALDILRLYKKRDVTEILAVELPQYLPHSNIDTESATDELQAAKLMNLGGLVGAMTYRLTAAGRKYIAQGKLE